MEKENQPNLKRPSPASQEGPNYTTSPRPIAEPGDMTIGAIFGYRTQRIYIDVIK